MSLADIIPGVAQVKAGLRIAVPIAFALSIAWGLRVDHLRAFYKADGIEVRREYASFQTQIIDRTREALAAQQAVNTAKEIEYAQKANAADSGYDALRRRYTDLMRAKAGGSAGGQASATAQGDGPSVPADPAAVSGIVLSEADALKLPELQAYADAAHEWAVTLAAPEIDLQEDLPR